MSKVTAKYQITLPKEVRNAMNIMPGIDISFETHNGRFYLVKTADRDPIDKWRGAFKTRRTVDEIMAAVRGYGLESVD